MLLNQENIDQKLEDLKSLPVDERSQVASIIEDDFKNYVQNNFELTGNQLHAIKNYDGEMAGFIGSVISRGLTLDNWQIERIFLEAGDPDQQQAMIKETEVDIEGGWSEEDGAYAKATIRFSC